MFSTSGGPRKRYKTAAKRPKAGAEDAPRLGLPTVVLASMAQTLCDDHDGAAHGAEEGVGKFSNFNE